MSGSSSVRRDLAWEPEGRQFKFQQGPKDGVWTGGWRGTSSPAELPLSMALNPNRSSGAAQWLADKTGCTGQLPGVSVNVIRAFLQKRASLSVNLP